MHGTYWLAKQAGRLLLQPWRGYLPLHALVAGSGEVVGPRL
jgi:hypothetical protein